MRRLLGLALVAVSQITLELTRQHILTTISSRDEQCCKERSKDKNVSCQLVFGESGTAETDVQSVGIVRPYQPVDNSRQRPSICL